MSAYIDTILQNPQYAVLSAISLITILVVNFSFLTKDEKYPFLIPKKPLELTDRRVVKEFISNSKSLLANSRTVYKDQPYRAYTEIGKLLVIPPSWVEALKSNRQLDFLIPAKDVRVGIDSDDSILILIRTLINISPGTTPLDSILKCRLSSISISQRP